MSRSAARVGARAKAGVFLPALSTWLRQSLFALVFLAILLIVQLTLGEFTVGNRWSLWYGGVAAGLLVLAAALSARRRAPRLASRWRLGSARRWLDLHIAAGIVFGALVALHVCFRLPHSSSGWALWMLSWWTVLTGLVGLFLQRWIPRVLASGLRVEVLYERAEALVAELEERAKGLVTEVGEPLEGFYRTELEGRFAGLQPRWLYVFDITGGRASVLRGLQHLEGRLAEDHRKTLRQLADLLETKLEIDAGYTLQRILRWWLWLHVPTSFVLSALVTVHIAVHLYY